MGEQEKHLELQVEVGLVAPLVVRHRRHRPLKHQRHVVAAVKAAVAVRAAALAVAVLPPAALAVPAVAVGSAVLPVGLADLDRAAEPAVDRVPVDRVVAAPPLVAHRVLPAPVALRGCRATLAQRRFLLEFRAAVLIATKKSSACGRS